MKINIMTAVVLLAIGAANARADELEVTRIRAHWRSDTNLVDISYNVESSNTGPLCVFVTISTNGGATFDVTAAHCSGDGVGPAVIPGRGKRIVWNAAADGVSENTRRLRYRMIAAPAAWPQLMVLIPAGPFKMGDALNEGRSDERPVHSVDVSAFYMDRFEVTETLWRDVYDWGIEHGYKFESWKLVRGGDADGPGKSARRPVSWVNWYDAVKWCNARSEKAGLTPCYYTGVDKCEAAVYREGSLELQNDWVKWDAAGYRLPTEAEWEKAARGGLAGRRFPWDDTDHIRHDYANYFSSKGDAYDKSSTRNFHPRYSIQAAPVGSFEANDYGLYDMAGNVSEWTWDSYHYQYYLITGSVDPHGSTSDAARHRGMRGGSWYDKAYCARVAFRAHGDPGFSNKDLGFRTVRAAAQ